MCVLVHVILCNEDGVTDQQMVIRQLVNYLGVGKDPFLILH